MESNTDGFTVTVSHGVATKTTLVEGFKTYWTYEDELTVFDAQLTNRCFAYRSSEDNGKTAVFETPEFIMPSEEHLATSPLVAVYPYNEDLSFAYPAMTLTGLNIPAAQLAEADNFDPEATIALAFSTAAGKDNLTFNNLYSLLKLVIKKDDVKKVTVKANGSDDKLVGTGSIQFNQQGGYEFTMTEGKNEVVLNGEFAKDNTYYVAVAPGTYANGFSVYLDDALVKTTTTSKTLQANYVYNLGNLLVKAERNLKFSAETAVVTLGDTFTAPKLTGETEGVVFTSSNPAAATVDQATGAVTIKGVGQTTITATAAENETHLTGTASYTLTVKAAKHNIYVLVKDLGWTEVNAIINGTSYSLSNTQTIASKKYYIIELEEKTYTSIVFNNGGTSNAFWKIDWSNVNLTADKYIRLCPKGVVEVNPEDETTFGYSIYVFDQKSKNVAPNLYVWGDGNAFNAMYPGWNYNWGGTAFPRDCYYKPADEVNWRHYYYIDIPKSLYNGEFSFIVNQKGQTSDIVVGKKTAKADDIEIEKISSDIYVGYWYNDSNNNGFWTNQNMSSPITNLN